MQLKKDQIQMEELKQGLQNIGLKVYLLKKKMSLNFELIIKLCKFCKPQALGEEKSVQTEYYNLVPRVSHLSTPWGERGKTLVWSGHMLL